MIASRKLDLRAKYKPNKNHDVDFLSVAIDVNEILDSLPETPRTKLLRKKYDIQTGSHSMMWWIAADDVNDLLNDVTCAGDPPPTSHSREGENGSTSPVVPVGSQSNPKEVPK